MALQAAPVGLPSAALAVATLGADKIAAKEQESSWQQKKPALGGRQIVGNLRETNEPG
jgi:hypothetical protein